MAFVYYDVGEDVSMKWYVWIFNWLYLSLECLMLIYNYLEGLYGYVFIDVCVGCFGMKEYLYVRLGMCMMVCEILAWGRFYGWGLVGDM